MIIKTNIYNQGYDHFQQEVDLSQLGPMLWARGYGFWVRLHTTTSIKYFATCLHNTGEDMFLFEYDKIGETHNRPILMDFVPKIYSTGPTVALRDKRMCLVLRIRRLHVASIPHIWQVYPFSTL